MARKRQISPEFWHDPKINKLCRDARLMFIGLVSNANDYGKLRGTPSTIRSKVFPEDDIKIEQIEEWLNGLSALKLILRYNIGGENYVYIVNWNKHQSVSHPQKDEFPEPPKDLLKSLTGKESSGMVLEQLAKSSKPHALLYLFNKLHKEYIGIDYMIFYARDTKIMKDIYNTYKEDKLINDIMEEYFEYGEDNKAWYYDKARSVPQFKGCIATIIQRLRGKK